MSVSFVIQSDGNRVTTSTTPVRILRAAHLGMCFGVRVAITAARELAALRPLTIFGNLVHNETVLADLRQCGIGIVYDPSAVITDSVMVTAHGASDRTIRRLRDRGLEVLEATCPLVRHVHRCVQELVATGFHPVIIGQRDHVEVRGVTEDLESYDVVLRPEDLAELIERPRFGVVAQTTQPIEPVRRLVSLLRQRFPQSEVRFLDTVCQPTKQRQAAATVLARRVELVIVIGGTHSNNTRQLVATCGRACARVHHVQSADDLQPEWFAGVRSIGLTAGTSTPDSVIDAVEDRIRTLTNHSISSHQVLA